jgi:CheY-like chemotaxis protein
MESIMTEHAKPITILLADDDAEDRELTREALAESRLRNDLRTVTDGEELMDYLHRRGKYTNAATSPRPGLILLDLAMPKKDGREVLAEIKGITELRRIPIVIMTTSSADEDISRSYDLGASSYVTKPVSFAALTEIMKVIGEYWFDIVELPGQ